MVKLSCKPSCKLSSKPSSKPSGSPGVYADDTASNTSHFFWSNCIICVSCIICANCIISTYCLNSPSISTFSKLSPSIIKAIGTYTRLSMLSPQYLTTRLGRRDGDRHEQNGTQLAWSIGALRIIRDSQFNTHALPANAVAAEYQTLSQKRWIVCHMIHLFPYNSKLSSPCALCCLPSQSSGTANVVSVFIARRQQGQRWSTTTSLSTRAF